MKAKIITIGTFLLVANFAFAQTKEEVAVIQKKEVPELVVNTFEEVFPKEDTVVWYSVPAVIEEPVWEVDLIEDDFLPKKTNHYSAMVKGKDYKRYVVYDVEGNIVRMKETADGVELPVSIKTKLAKDYKGWKVVGDEERIIVGRTNAVYFKVKLQKGNEKQIVYFDLVGNTFLVRK